jgi:hypothetical protein
MIFNRTRKVMKKEVPRGRTNRMQEAGSFFTVGGTICYGLGMSNALPFQTAKQLAAAIRKKKIGCVELLDLYLKRIEAYNPALNAVIANAGPNTKIVPGHGPTVDRNAVTAHRDMVIALRDKVAALVKEGKTQEQVVAAKPTADFDAKVQQPGTTGDRFIGQLYAELKK